MPREIKDPADLTQPPPDSPQGDAGESAPPKPEQKAVTFIKNHINELVILPGGRKFKFEKPRLVTTDKKLIEHLKSVAARHNIIVVENE